MNKGNFYPSERTKIRTNAIRAVYDKEEITRILDESFLCHLGFSVKDQPFIIPVCYGRDNNKIYFHGAKSSRMFNTFRNGAEICAAISIVDGIVLARSAFNHTINYRSVIIFGKANELTDNTEKSNALRIITEHIIPGRWEDVRKPTPKELNATSLFSLDINEASAKIRSGPPLDNKEDLNLEIWAGVLPLKIVDKEPVMDLSGKNNINKDNLPDYIRNYNQRHTNISKRRIES